MNWKPILIIIIGILLIFAHATPTQAQYTLNRTTPTINYYPEKKLEAKETEGLLRSAGMLMVTGLVYLEPEAVIVFGRAFKKAYNALGSEQLFQLMSRLL